MMRNKRIQITKYPSFHQVSAGIFTALNEGSRCDRQDDWYLTLGNAAGYLDLRPSALLNIADTRSTTPLRSLPGADALD